MITAKRNIRNKKPRLVAASEVWPQRRWGHISNQILHPAPGLRKRPGVLFVI